LYCALPGPGDSDRSAAVRFDTLCRACPAQQGRRRAIPGMMEKGLQHDYKNNLY
jgi:hypothetical protein